MKVMNQNNRYPEPPVDLTPYLNNSILSRVAEVLWNGIFQPLEKLADKLARRWTKKFCQENIPVNERV